MNIRESKILFSKEEIQWMSYKVANTGGYNFLKFVYIFNKILNFLKLANVCNTLFPTNGISY